ncbi:hypothetical protein [Falsiroseomonas sp.]|uniref:hypothetical protein n=1 Tax=Falsiroseomonas sp. TaxID=2870721 RepID=UPI00356B5A7E
MDDATAFAIELVEAVSPADVDQAPALLKAAEDDAAWAKTISPRSGATPGGVVEGAGMSEATALMDAIRNASSVLSSLALIASSTLAISVHRLTIREKKLQAATSEDEVQKKVEDAARLIGERLAQHGIDSARADEIARAALGQIAKDAQKARSFLARLRGKGR